MNTTVMILTFDRNLKPTSKVHTQRTANTARITHALPSSLSNWLNETQPTRYSCSIVLFHVHKWFCAFSWCHFNPTVSSVVSQPLCFTFAQKSQITHVIIFFPEFSHIGPIEKCACKQLAWNFTAYEKFKVSISKVALYLTSNNGNCLNANILPGKEKNKVGF